MTQTERVMQRLYEDTAWREDLTDSEAEIMLKWAETKISGYEAEVVQAIGGDEITRSALHAEAQHAEKTISDPDDVGEDAGESAAPVDPFERHVEAVRQTLRKINRFIAERPIMPPEDQQTLIDEIADLAGVDAVLPAQLNAVAVSEDEPTRSGAARSMGAMSAQNASGDNSAILHALTAWLDGRSLPASDASVMTSTASSAESPVISAAAPVVVMGKARSVDSAPPESDPTFNPTSAASAAAVFDFFNTAPSEPESAADSPSTEEDEDDHDDFANPT